MSSGGVRNFLFFLFFFFFFLRKTKKKVIVKYFECGKCYFGSKDKPTQAGNFVVQRYSNIELKIIPFFNKYPILGSKSEDFKDFKVLIKNKEHLIKEGLLQIKNIKAGMNTGRKLK